MISEIKIAGLFGLCAFIIYVGYLFYDKDKTISYLLIISGLILAIIVIGYEIDFKKKRHQAPWQFDNYKGE